jgi:hypothetical protein
MNLEEEIDDIRRSITIRIKILKIENEAFPRSKNHNKKIQILRSTIKYLRTKHSKLMEKLK